MCIYKSNVDYYHRYTWQGNTCDVKRTIILNTKLYNTDLNALGIQPKTMR